MKYRKPSLSISDQITNLKERGLIISDEKKSAHYLSNISYYRLRAYTYPFQNNDRPDHPFIQDISFEEIISLYVFDRRLRILVFNALEKIEIALRTKIIYEYAIVHGSHWHEEQALFRSREHFIKHTNSLYDEINRSTETFIEHYKDTYDDPIYPPAWMSLEVASFGLLSKIFRNLIKGEEKKKITREFGLTKPEILESWMHAIANMRNVVAHHGRLWNRRFIAKPQIPYNTIYPFLKNRNIYENKLYAILCCMNYILRIISPGNSFVNDFRNLLKYSTLIELHEMGFPADWENEIIWQE